MSENPLIQELRDMLAFAAGYKSKNHPGAEAFVPASIASVRAALDELDLLRATPGGATEIHVLDNGSHVTGERAALLLDDEIRGHKITASRCVDLERALTALQESNREVVAERDREWKAHWETQVVLKDLRARLALADDLAKALEEARKELHRFCNERTTVLIRVDAALSRWTAPQAGTTLGGDDNAREVLHRDVTPAIPSEPASRAVPITPETVVPKEDKLC